MYSYVDSGKRVKNKCTVNMLIVGKKVKNKCTVPMLMVAKGLRTNA